jgi:hypothetical protein
MVTTLNATRIEPKERGIDQKNQSTAVLNQAETARYDVTD